MTKVLGIGGIFFKSHDPKKLADWYATWLSFEIDPTFGGATFQASILPAKAYTVWSPITENTDYFNPSTRPFMLNLIVDDLAAALQQVAMGGATLVSEPQDLEYGRFGWFMDPDGNKVELWQPI
ncbi:MAG TPA: VOC family protein [Gammaproteobacteria bacterium]|nr:VOC family protein [Gammaproteobacteria bacterium]